MTESNDATLRKFLENLQSDLRALSAEARKKHPQIKDATETCTERIRNIASRGIGSLIAGLASSSTEILHPLLMGCDSKTPRLIQLSLNAIQRLASYSAIDENGARCTLNELGRLAESGTEELKLLQTATILISQCSVVRGHLLAKGLLLCLRLHLSGKDAVVCNAASATVRQIISAVVERANSDFKNGKCSGGREADSQRPEVHHPSGAASLDAPATLSPVCRDAFMLFQDLCILLGNDRAVVWLTGLQRIPRSLGLDLIESILSQAPTLFLECPEFSALLKEQLCPLMIRLFPSSGKQALPAHHAVQPNTGTQTVSFPIAMRLLRIVSMLVTTYYPLLVTECEIFISLLLKFLITEKLQWQQALALEVLHRVTVRPDLLRRFCLNYDLKPHSTRVLQDISNALGTFVQTCLMTATTLSKARDVTPPPASPEEDRQSPVAQMAGQPGFVYGTGAFVPLTSAPLASGQAKSLYLDMRDKSDVGLVQEGHCLSVAFLATIDFCQSLYSVFEEEAAAEEQHSELLKQLLLSTHGPLLGSLTTLLEASLDENITESTLRSMQLLVSLSCRVEQKTERDSTLFSLCRASLPPAYMQQVIVPALGKDVNAPAASQDPSAASILSRRQSRDAAPDRLSQIVANVSPCPTPSMSNAVLTTPVGITTKNIQCMRALLSSSQIDGEHFDVAWRVVLATVQHFSWMLCLGPAAGHTGSPTQGAQQQDGYPVQQHQLTTAVMADIPVLQSLVTKVFQQTRKLDDVALHHVLDALCELSRQSIAVASMSGREPSLFGVHRLLETGLMNAHERIQVFWKPVTAHLLEVAAQPHARLRDEGAFSLMTLIGAALRCELPAEMSREERLRRQRMIIGPLCAASEIAWEDVRRRQQECVTTLLREHGRVAIEPALWQDLIATIGAVVSSDVQTANGDCKFSVGLISCGFDNIQGIVTEQLGQLNSDCIRTVSDVCGAYGSQQADFNISLAAIGLLWNISDYLFRNHTAVIKTNENGSTGIDDLWVNLFSCLSNQCTDPRPPVRKSATQTLFQTITAHGALLQPGTWNTVLWKVLFPLLDRVRERMVAASNDRSDSDQIGGGQNILIHHSRDTASKQWAETRVLTLTGVARMFTMKRSILVAAGDFSKSWQAFLDHIDAAAHSENAEVALCSLKSYQELLGITVAVPPSAVPKSQRNKGVNRQNTTSTSSMDETSTGDQGKMTVLKTEFWLAAWNTWLNIAGSCRLENASRNDVQKIYVSPSGQYVTTLLSILPPLFQCVKSAFKTSDMSKLSDVLTNIACMPVTGGLDFGTTLTVFPQQSPEITPSQAALLSAIDAISRSAVLPDSRHQACLPAIFELLCHLATYSCALPHATVVALKRSARATEAAGGRSLPTITDGGSAAQWLLACYVPFAESALRSLTDLYSRCNGSEHILQTNVLTLLVKTVRQPMVLKYNSAAQSTWQLALRCWLHILRTGLPYARNHQHMFAALWPEIAGSCEEFLFNSSVRPQTLSMQEIRDHEKLDCELIAFLRSDVLPYAQLLPEHFVSSLIELLNRGSVIVDPTMREHLATTCFDTLLHMSVPPPDVVQGPHDLAHGRRAMLSLLQRCRHVLQMSIDDRVQRTGMPLARHRVAEMKSVLRALSALVRRVVSGAPAELHREVVSLYGKLVECVACMDDEYKIQLVETLSTYALLFAAPTAGTDDLEHD